MSKNNANRFFLIYFNYFGGEWKQRLSRMFAGRFNFKTKET